MALWHSNLEDTVSPKINEEQERSRKILSKKAKTQREKIANAVKYGKFSLEETVSSKDANEVRWHSNDSSDLETVSSSMLPHIIRHNLVVM